MRFFVNEKDVAQNRLDGYFLHMEKAGSNSLSVDVNRKWFFESGNAGRIQLEKLFVQQSLRFY